MMFSLYSTLDYWNLTRWSTLGMTPIYLHIWAINYADVKNKHPATTFFCINIHPVLVCGVWWIGT